MMRFPIVVVLASVFVCVSACTGSIFESKIPTPDIYVLAAAAPNENGTALPVDIAIARPTAAPGLDTDRIAVLHESRRLDYYQEAQWGGNVPQVVQSLIVGSLRNQKLFRSVTTEQARVTVSYLLDLEVRDFQAEYESDSAPPTVKVTVVGSLIRIKDRKLVGTFPTTYSVPATANRLSAVATAFESAAQQAAVSLGKQATNAMATMGD